MIARNVGMLCAACLVSLLVTPSTARPPTALTQFPSPARPAGVSTLDFARRLDGNRMKLIVTNLGALGYDPQYQYAGLWYPYDSGTTLLFASGLWLGAVVNGATRVTVSGYQPEYFPGPIVGGGPGIPAGPEDLVWKVRRWTGDPRDTAHVERAAGGFSVDELVHHSWSEYMAGAVPGGAPWKLYRFPATSTPDPSDSIDVRGPDVLGDLMTWCVFNDADPGSHGSAAGGTPPLGAEVEQVVFVFDDPGPMGDAAFVRWRVRNRGGSTWTDCRAGFWADPDIGGSLGFTDDKVGCDTTRSVGYAYNGDPSDGGYGPNPPVLGTVLLSSSPVPSGGRRLGMDAFVSFVSGTDPRTFTESYFSLSGLDADGTEIVDPFGDFTRYMYSGNPMTGTGWLDPASADKRMVASFAGREVLPGDSLELWAALLVAPEPGLTAALEALPCRTDYVRAVFESGFARPFPPATGCEAPRNCPRPAEYWAAQCAGAGGYATPVLASLASLVDQRSTALDFGLDPYAPFCAMLVLGGDVRQQAYREFAAFMANISAATNALQPVGEMPVVLVPTTAVNCPGIPALSVGELATTAPFERAVTGAYRNLVATNRTPIEGVNWGLSGFNGGAASAFDFLGSSLDPSTQPDSFPSRVLVTFDHARPQKAYRYLSAKRFDGSPPSVGRGYRYAGFVDVPFTVRDSVTGEQLDVAFVEWVVTDDSGTIQPGAFQPASFDSAWRPTTDQIGGFEYLFVSRRAYTGIPRPDFAVDGAIVAGDRPLLYALSSRLRAEADVFDDGDAFAFGFEYPYTPGVDAVLRDLEGRPLSDPAVADRYAQIADCLGAINRGESVGPTCDEPTPALASLMTADAEPGLVRVEWLLASPERVTVERREESAKWRDLVTAMPDGSGRVAITDRDVRAGASYDYRLRLASGYAGQVTLQVPSQHRLSLAGFRPNPAVGPLAVAFTLASSAPARLEVLDVAGRRVFARTIERPLAGRRVLPLADVRLAPGLYVLRLEQGGERLVARGIVLR